MPRFVDYFAVAGYCMDPNSKALQFDIIQRFPKVNWDDYEFPSGIQPFCRPTHCDISTTRKQPTFVHSILTDQSGDTHYCATLTFYEDFAKSDNFSNDDDFSDGSNSQPLYSPKTLMIVSTYNYYKTFKNCLQLFYMGFTEPSYSNNWSLETMIVNLIGKIEVPRPNSNIVEFQLTNEDRQFLHPLNQTGILATEEECTMLFQLLGISNVITLISATLMDERILFHSNSLNRLTEAGHALISLLFPLKYLLVFVPMVPADLMDILYSPTPYICGIHSSVLPDYSELANVIIVHLDYGNLYIPENIQIKPLPPRLVSRVENSLQKILSPDLFTADDAFTFNELRVKSCNLQDKMIRAVFIRFFAELFLGYRTCLLTGRLYNPTFIFFDYAKFLGQSDLLDNKFTINILHGMSFSTFIDERKSPFRKTDIFDEVYSNIAQSLLDEHNDPNLIMEHIIELAKHIPNNELDYQKLRYRPKMPSIKELALERIHQVPFPRLNEIIIEEGLKNAASDALKRSPEIVQDKEVKRIVPIGSNYPYLKKKLGFVNHIKRQLEVLRGCVKCIFENKIADALKVFHAVKVMMKKSDVRIAFVDNLHQYTNSSDSELNVQQFKIVVELLQAALTYESTIDEYGVVQNILPIVTVLYKYHNNSKIYAYFYLQDYAVWQNKDFWITCYYRLADKNILNIYSLNTTDSSTSLTTTPQPKWPLIDLEEQTALNVTGEQLRQIELRKESLKTNEFNNINSENVYPWVDKDKLQQEEQASFSQMLSFLHYISIFRVNIRHSDSKKSKEVGSIYNESIHDDNDDFETDTVNTSENEKMIKICDIEEFIKQFGKQILNESQPKRKNETRSEDFNEIIHMNVTSSLDVLKTAPQICDDIEKQTTIIEPFLLPGEHLVCKSGPLRAYLLPDGRLEGSDIRVQQNDNTMRSPSLPYNINDEENGFMYLPANGSVFLTNYRIVFSGLPMDSYAREMKVYRSFPICSLLKEKRLTAVYVQDNITANEGWQLRSFNFELMRLAFHNDIPTDKIKLLKDLLLRYRYPIHINSTFAYAGPVQLPLVPTTLLNKRKEKTATLTLKTMLKKTLGFSQSHSNKKLLTMASSPTINRRFDQASDTSISDLIERDMKSVEKIYERSFIIDFDEQQFISLRSDDKDRVFGDWKATIANFDYKIIPTYPALFLIPSIYEHANLPKLAKCFRLNRLPLVTWKHPQNKTFLLRGSAFHNKGLLNMFKYNTSATTSDNSGIIQEQERFLNILVNLTPAIGTSNKYDSINGLDSFLKNNLQVSSNSENPGQNQQSNSAIKRTRVQSVFVKATNRLSTITNVVRGSVSTLNSLHTDDSFNESSEFKDDNLPQSSFEVYLEEIPLHRCCSDSTSKPIQKKIADKCKTLTVGATSEYQNINGSSISISNTTSEDVRLFVFCDKNQTKGIRLELCCDLMKKCSFFAIDYNTTRAISTSMAKLLKVCAPSRRPKIVTDVYQNDNNFLKEIEDTRWLEQISNILKISGTIVDLLDLRGASVLTALEDGRDATAQISALTQICLDKRYRTMHGFKLLVEKEWLSFGHEFSKNLKQFDCWRDNSIAPFFLQWLDCVHQIMEQFPSAFEFNNYYLKFLAYHVGSNRFRTFMLNNDYERAMNGFFFNYNDKNGGRAMSPPLVTSSTHETSQLICEEHMPSIWDYIDAHHDLGPYFMNFLYVKSTDSLILRPCSAISSITLWDYFLDVNLGHESLYDLEIHKHHCKIDDTEIKNERRVVNICYDNIKFSICDKFTSLLNGLETCDLSLDQAQISNDNTHGVWSEEWAEANKSAGMINVNDHLTKEFIRNKIMAENIHKQTTLSVLTGRKLNKEDDFHEFEAGHLGTTRRDKCEACTSPLSVVPTSKTSRTVRCKYCYIYCHEKCSVNLTNMTCPQHPSITMSNSNTVESNGLEHKELNHTELRNNTLKDNNKTIEAHSFDNSDIVHKGLLSKRNHKSFVKNWNERFFVLDSHSHELRYYLTELHYKNNTSGSCIKLSEIEDVGMISNNNNIRSEYGKPVFQLTTSKRIYYLSTDEADAKQWIESIKKYIV